MENLKIKTLAMAICVAVGLSACGDNNATLSAQQLSAQQEIDNMLLKLKEGEYFKSDIQNKVFELFPATNTRMEQNLENCQWYAKHDLFPAWGANNKLTELELEMNMNQTEWELINSFIEEQFDKNKKFIKENLFTNEKFDKNKLNQEKADTMFCLLFPKKMHSQHLFESKKEVLSLITSLFTNKERNKEFTNKERKNEK